MTTEQIVETRETALITISETGYSKFKQEFGQGKFGSQRLGQAFFNYFDLEKMDHRGRFDSLYNSTDPLATVRFIRQNFTFS